MIASLIDSVSYEIDLLHDEIHVFDPINSNVIFSLLKLKTAKCLYWPHGKYTLETAQKRCIKLSLNDSNV